MIDFAELEHSVVGAICLEPRYIERISGKVSPDDFTIAACAAVFEAAREAYTGGKPFDAAIAAQCLLGLMPEKEAHRFISECMNVTPTAANAEHHAALVRQRANKRRLQAISLEIFDGLTDPREAAAQMVDVCQTFLETENPERLKTLGRALEQMYDNQTRTSHRIDTGFYELDRKLKGMWGGNLILIGARPGVGKSAFAMELARAAALRGNKVLIYSLEMLADEWAERLVARESELSLDALIDDKAGAFNWEELVRACSQLHDLPIYINDDPATTVSKIRAEARSIKDLRMIIVDFVTLMRSDKRHENRNLEVGAISRALKNLASELKIPVIALTQLNRGTDDTQQPTLRSLRDSGELEQNANKVILMWHIDKDEGEVGVSVAKNRRGRTGVVKMHFDGAHMKYTEMQEPYRPAAKKRRAYDNDYGDE